MKMKLFFYRMLVRWSCRINRNYGDFIRVPRGRLWAKKD
jgi:hypothetical protein